MKFQSSQRIFFFASAVLPAVFAQTHRTCNPLTSCAANPALGGTYEWDFIKGGASDKFTATGSPANIKYDSNGMTLPVKNSGDSPTITSNFYIFWGKVDIVMKAAPGQGIISSLVFESDDLDEIDYEWVGSETSQVQTNYFGKGDTSSYDRGGKSPVTTPADSVHTYTIEWTKDNIIWSIDGNPIRTLLPSQVTGNAVNPDLYPQTPMQIKIGSWSGGDPANAPGTIQWAGGATDYTKGPYNMVVQSIKVQDYTVGAQSYRYGDNSGKDTSIIVTGGSGQASGGSDTSSSSAASQDSTTTASSAAAPTSSSTAGTTLSTTTKPSTTSSSPATKTSSSAASATPTDMNGHIIAGMPNSVGTYAPNNDKGVSASASSTSTSSPSATKASATKSSAPAQTNNAGSLQASFGGLLVGAVAAAALL